MPGYFISFDDEGQLSDEIKLKTKERFAQFEIHLVSLSTYLLFQNQYCSSSEKHPNSL
jgi:hypothetical protein